MINNLIFLTPENIFQQRSNRAKIVWFGGEMTILIYKQLNIKI